MALPHSSRQTVVRALTFALASSAAVCFPLVLGKILWPHGLSAGAEFIFWLASGVNAACILRFGWRYWPMILVGVFPAWLVFGQSLEQSLLGAAGNAIEAVLAWWILHRIGRFEGRFDRIRTVVALLLAGAVAPVAASLTMPAYLVFHGRFTVGEFWMAVGNWNLANGTAILVLTPFLLALRRGPWMLRGHLRESLAWLLAGLLCGAVAFNAVFQARGLNFAFLIFPFIIFVAVRFGPAETAAALALVMASIYGSLARHAASLPPGQAPAILWFVQAFLWVLAATGLVVAALVAERRQAEERVRREQRRTLEASLREERARLSALRYQINPHFLFNALNSIRATLPLAEDTPREMVTELADYLRSTLARPDSDLASVREEMESVEHYLAIEQKRFGEALQVAISVDAAAREIPIPVFLLQPLVENAVRYGFETCKSGFRLEIRAAVFERKLLLEVANTGTWASKENGSGSRKSVGLENIRKRLALLYGTEAALSTQAADGWVRVFIELPFNKG